MSNRTLLAVCAAVVVGFVLATLAHFRARPAPETTVALDPADVSTVNLHPEREAHAPVTVLERPVVVVESSAANTDVGKVERKAEEQVEVEGSMRATRASATAAWLRALLPEKFANLTPAAAEQLTQLDLQGAQITDADLAHLRGLPRLRELSLRETAATDAGMFHIASLKQLRQLDLRSTSIAGSGLQQLRSSGLEELHLTQTKVTEADIVLLPPMPSLKVLKLNSLPLGDSALDVLQGYPGLRHLELDNTRITDDGLRRLVAANPYLERIELRSTFVTPAVLQELATAYPKLTILHGNG